MPCAGCSHCQSIPQRRGIQRVAGCGAPRKSPARWRVRRVRSWRVMIIGIRCHIPRPPSAVHPIPHPNSAVGFPRQICMGPVWSLYEVNLTGCLKSVPADKSWSKRTRNWYDVDQKLCRIEDPQVFPEPSPLKRVRARGPLYGIIFLQTPKHIIFIFLCELCLSTGRGARITPKRGIHGE